MGDGILKKWLYVISFIFILSALSLILLWFSMRESSLSKQNRISSEDLAKMLSFTNDSIEEWKEILSEQRIARHGLTYSDLKPLLQRLNVDSYITYAPDPEEKYVSMEAWYPIYSQILTILDPSGQVKKKKRLILKKETDGIYITTKGKLKVFSKEASLQEMTEYQMWMLDQEAVCWMAEKECELSNVWIEESSKEDKTLTLYYGDTNVTLKEISLEFYPNQVLADLTFQQGKLSRIFCKERMLTGVLEKKEKKTLSIQGAGDLPVSERFVYVDLTGKETALKKKKALQIGETYEFVIVQGEICGCILTKKEDEIRILLSDQNGQYEMNELKICGAGEYKVISGEDVSSFHGEEIFSVQSVDKNKPLLIKSYKKDSPLYLKELKAGTETIPYYGELRIYQGEHGVFATCTTDVETYLKGVVPGEMPPGYEMEALKAQAICARSYAYAKLAAPVYEQYHADVDDTTNCQVYNMTGQYDSTNQAVEETKGIVMEYQGEFLEACYFSTSCGRTTNADLWNDEPKEKIPYLKSVSISPQKTGKKLNREKDFLKFISTDQNNDYENSEKWYRWRAELDFENRCGELSAAVLEELSHDSVFVKASKAPAELPRSLTFMGIRVGIRSDGGNVMSLQLDTREMGQIEITSESMIRKLLFFVTSKIFDHTKAEAQTETKLPSSFFAISEVSYGKKKRLKQVVLLGGGHGHGAGMSQMGANHLAADGYRAEDILNFFYQGISIGKKR